MEENNSRINWLNILIIPILALWIVSVIWAHWLGKKSASTLDVSAFQEKLAISQRASIEASKAALRAQNRARSTLDKLQAIKHENQNLKEFLLQKIPPEIVCVGLNRKQWINGVCK